ncbi:carbonic anhydrase [Obelidium mucronatum]|nr:carbonic anhydrase [Obelidium mucronatum]
MLSNVPSPADSTAASVHDPTHVDTLAELLNNNREWATSMRAANPGLLERLAKQQTPEILWIGCSDSRVPAEFVCGLGPGDLFVHRNIANVVTHTDLSCLSVIQYAVDVLKVKHIIVCGHYQCGGCLTAMSNKQYGLIDNWLRNIKDIYNTNKDKLAGLTPAEQATALIELNVAKSVLNICHTTIVQNAWDRGQELSVHGWCYQLEDGIIQDLKLCVNKKNEIDDYLRICNCRLGKICKTAQCIKDPQCINRPR